MNPFFCEPLVRVGLCENASFGLHPIGKYCINAADSMITYQPLEDNASMLVKGITIGRDFHWHRKCDLRYAGIIQLIKDESTSRLVNILKAEKYLESVVGSEMSPTAPYEFIKAHAIISRSWLMRILSGKTYPEPEASADGENIMTWSQASAHTGYDVCCDDHCQRYQGLDAVKEVSAQAVKDTRGIVLAGDDGEIVDARYSKCCGGRTEIYSTCWEDKDYVYLQSVEDEFCEPARLHKAMMRFPDMLKSYDMETSDYYRWTREISADMIRENLKSRFAKDIGEIFMINPVKRGKSGRIRELEISGSNGRIVIGKELAIRRLLSPSHLYSSNLEVEKRGDKFVLNGKGWGHGVGLCQIGAAVMGAEGYKCEEILAHYYPGASLKSIYE